MDISSLVELLKKDSIRDGAYDRYPVRFLSMKYEEGVSDDIIQLQIQMGGLEVFDVKDILVHDDAWVTVENFINSIKQLNQYKNYIVIGFSEYARFLGQEEFISLLISLLEVENAADNPKRRIYVPCFALYSQIKKIIRQYHRRMDAYNPLLNETDVEDLPRIFFMEDSLSLEEQKNEISNSSEWFGMWRNQNIDTKRPITCSSKTLAHFYDKASSDNVYNIQRIKSYQDVLRYMYSINDLREYKKEPEEFYRQLVLLIKKKPGKDIADIILAELNAQNIDANNVYSLWKSCNVFKRWLIQVYILHQSNEESYLYNVMEALDELTDKEFLEKTYKCIFEYQDASLCKERKLVLQSICRIEKDINFTNTMVLYYKEIIASIVRRKTTIVLNEIDLTKDNEILIEKRDVLVEAFNEEFTPYLTCFSAFERQLIIWLYRMNLINEQYIETIYPNLWDYIKISETNSYPASYVERFEAYFDKYRKMKLAQVDVDTYDASIGEWNKDENSFFAWYLDGELEYPETYLKRRGFKGNIYVIDAMGAEFMGYVQALLSRNGYSVKDACYAKCHIPSITSMAKSFYPETYEWILDYDNKVVHGDTYYHVDNMEKSLSTIESIINDIIFNESGNSFAIIADHGSTVGHKLKRKDKKYNFNKAEHGGRCYKNKNCAYVMPAVDYVVYDDENGSQWVIALNQQSLWDNSKYAAHGGATLEEVLVPVIVAEKGKQTTVSYRVKAENLKVSGLQRAIEVKITPMPKDVCVKLKAKDGTDVEMHYDDQKKTWIGELKRGMEQDIQIVLAQQTFGFRTIPSTKMGDDLFDE